MSRQVCPLHADDDVAGVLLEEAGAWQYTCPRDDGHPAPGPYTWTVQAPPPAPAAVLSLSAEFGLDDALPAAIAAFPGQWVEFGAVEAAYADAHPDDFATLVSRYGHSAVARVRSYTVSWRLSRVLSGLAARGAVLKREEQPATGRWRHNTTISWWALAPEPDWETSQTSWESLGRTMDYVPGNTEG